MLSQLINTTKHDNVRIDALRLDGGTQPRQGINTAYVDELTASIVEGATLPPVEVIYDGTNYWLYDGFHRVAAHQAAGILIIDANIHQGTQADAQWRSYAANQTHGLRRTNDDKQRAIKAALRHPNGVTMANREIARHLGVDEKTVRLWREKLQASAEIPQMDERTVTRNGTTYTQNTANVGAKPGQPVQPIPQPAAKEYSAAVQAAQPAASRPLPTNGYAAQSQIEDWLTEIPATAAQLLEAAEMLAGSVWDQLFHLAAGEGYELSPLTSKAALRNAASQAAHEERKTAVSNQPSQPEKLTGFALRQRLVDRTITDAYNLPGSVSLVLDNGQTITINGTGLYFTVKEA